MAAEKVFVPQSIEAVAGRSEALFEGIAEMKADQLAAYVAELAAVVAGMSNIISSLHQRVERLEGEVAHAARSK